MDPTKDQEKKVLEEEEKDTSREDPTPEAGLDKKLDQLLEATGKTAGAVKSVLERQTAIEEDLRSIKESQGKMETRISTLEDTPTPRRLQHDPAQAKGPHVTKGPVGEDSRGYSILRLVRALVSKDRSLAKYECHVSDTLINLGYPTDKGKVGLSFLVPMDTRNLVDEDGQPFIPDLRERMKAGISGIDPHEVIDYIRTKAPSTLSELTESLGGALVPMVQSADLIDALRAMVVMERLGVRNIPMPRSGRLSLPRVTGDSGYAWIGESENINTAISGQMAFGNILLIAKKLGLFQPISNEVLSDSSPAMEGVVRTNFAQVAARAEQLAFFEGSGANNEPLGLINISGIQTLSATTTGANGDTFEPQDPYRIVSNVEENNAIMEAFVMRPITRQIVLTRRAKANTETTNAGGFMFDAVRGGAGMPDMLAGYPMHSTTAISNTRIKGSGTTLTYVVGGQWSGAIVSRMGTLEIAASAEAGNAFVQDQTWIRGLLRVDFGYSQAAMWTLMDDLLQS